MMIKKILINVLGFFSALITFSSCRQESILQETIRSNHEVRVLNQKQFQSKKALVQEISKVKNQFFRQVNLTGKTAVQDSILDGAIIETHKVMEYTVAANKTYTFPLSRTFPNNKVENLVLKKNADGSFTGVLIQYQLTDTDKQNLHAGQNINLQEKMKVYKINDLALNKSEYSYAEGCYTYTYETSQCLGEEHHEYGDSDCPYGPNNLPWMAAQITSLVSIDFICEDAQGGVPITTTPGSGGGSDPLASYNPYNTFIFTSYDDGFLACADGDTTCQINWANQINTVDFFCSNGMNVMSISGYNSIFFAAKDYLIANSFSPVAQLFLAERLVIIGDWLNNQDNSTNEKALSNYKTAKWIFDLFMEDDTQDIQNFFNRVTALDNALLQNPNLLLNIPCDQLPHWQDVATHQVPQSVKNKLQNINNLTNWFQGDLEIQNLDNANGRSVNMDLFEVSIQTMPNKPGTSQKFTPKELFDYFRLNLNDFAKTFTPVNDPSLGVNDFPLWNSANPLGALISIDIPVIGPFKNDGTVVCTGVSTNAWVFTTITSPWDDEHPVSGSRFFAYHWNGTIMTIYTRGVDRVNTGASLVNLLSTENNPAFAGADALWSGMQQKIKKFVTDNGGTDSGVTIQTPKIYRRNWNKIKEYLKNKQPLSSLGCN